MRRMNAPDSAELLSKASATPNQAPKSSSAPLRKNAQLKTLPNHAILGVESGPCLCILSLLASIACTTTENGVGGNAPAAGGNATASGGHVATGPNGGTISGTGSNSASGAAATAGGSSATGGFVGAGSNSTGGGATAPMGGAGTGGVSTASNSTGGGATAPMGGAGTGSVGTGSNSARGGANALVGGAATGGFGPGGIGAASNGTGGGANAGVGGAGTGGVGTGGVADTVTRTTSTYAFKHFPIQTNSDGVWNGSSTPGTQVTTTTYNTVVLENGYLRVTLLPDYGGRILSMVHKPTNREILYQNPIGTPYLMLQGIFYYDYLVIMGGIFPSFPEPEHGKYWNQPYSLKVVSESKDAITLRMSRKDDLNVPSGVPTKYDVGRTDVLVELDVTLRAGSTSLELATKLTNTQSKSIPKFEYWTNTTLAPGSTPGKTAIPLNTRILAAMDKAHLLESSWAWFASAEERVNGEVFKWNNLSYFKNWTDQGIAYASPDYRANWSGLINYDNNMGALCVSDNVKTPGLKIWTFGKGSLNIDINDSTQWLRPTIELWHGVTPEFWTRGSMSANEVRQWSDRYFPTLGLKEVTAATENGALYLSSSKSGTDTVLSVAATLTLPNQTVKAILRLNGTAVAEQDLVVATTDPTTVSTTVATSKISTGAVFKAEFLQGGNTLLSGQIALQ